MGWFQTLMAAGSVGVGAPTWLMASTRNKYGRIKGQTSTGGGVGLLSRYPVTIGSGDVDKLRLVFNNSYITSSGEFTDTSTVIIDEVALERVASTNATPVYFSGVRTASLTAGTVDFQSDDIFPSAFGLSKFTKGDEYFIKVKARVATNGDFFPGSRSIQEGGTQRAWRYNYSAGVVSSAETYGNFTAVSGTPAITNEGTGGNSHGFTAMVIGYYSNGNAKVFGVTGDSIIDGTSSPNDGTFIQYACNTAANGPYSMFEVSAGGADPDSFNAGGMLYRTLFKYCRVLIDELGTNGPGKYTQMLSMYSAARDAGVKRVYKTKLLPRTYSTNNGSTLTRAGTTATITISSGILPPVGASIAVSGATPSGYNGNNFTVTRSGSGSFDYTLASDPGSDATGTIRWSDKWTTEANQQYTPAGSPGGANDLQDQWALARVSDGTLDGVWPLLAVRGVDLFKWKTSTPAIPNDAWGTFNVGTHPTTVGNNLLAAEVSPLLDAITVPV